MRPASIRGVFAIVAVVAAQCLLWGQAKVPEVSVPFVGCESDGQVGPLEVPKGSAIPVPISAADAQKLAYYKAGDGLAILAPRGWNCLYVYGSGGDVFFVSPNPINSSVMADQQGFAGSLIALDHKWGDSSGRFSVAEVIAQVFPAYAAFVARVKEGFEFEKFPPGPYEMDKLTRKGDSVVEYTTPAMTRGLGTHGWVKAGKDPISGVAILTGGEPDLYHLAVRLPANLRSLAPAIIQQLERETAKLPKPSPPAPLPSR